MQDRDLARGTGYLVAGAGPVLVAGVLVPVADRSVVPAVAVLTMAAIVTWAGRGGIGPALGSATMATLAIDFWFVHPFRQLNLDQGSLAVAALLAAVGIAAVLWSRRRSIHPARTAAGRSGPARRNRSRHIERVTGLIAQGTDADDLVATVAAELRSLLLLRTCRYERGDRPTARPLLERDGSVSGTGSDDGDPDQLTAPVLELPVRGGGRVVGRFVLEPNPAASVPLDHRLVAVILSDHLGAALVGAPAPLGARRQGTS